MSTKTKSTFNNAAGQAAANAPIFTKEDTRTKRKFISAILVFVTIFLSEYVVLLLRKDVGKEAIYRPAITVAIIFTFLISGLLLLGFFYTTDSSIGSGQSYLVCSVLYLFLSVFSISTFRNHTYRNRSSDSDDPGISRFFTFLLWDRWTRDRIFLWAEPLFLLSLGITIAFYNLFGSVLFIACGLSVWARIIVELYYDKGSINKDNSAGRNKYYAS